MRCIAQCPPGSYADNSTWKCVPICPSNPALYGDIVARVCVINCPNSYYGDDSTRTCVPVCATSPVVYFTYAPTHRCLQSCLYPYFGQKTGISIGTCVLACYLGQYKNMTTHNCEQCLSVCTQCLSYLGCQACIANYYLFNGSCLSGCASGSGSSCQAACPTNFLTGMITYADDLSQSCV